MTRSLVVVALVASALGAQPKTSFTADLGAISASGNTRLRTLSLGDKLTHTNGRWVLGQLAAYVFGQTNSVTSANQLRGALRADYLLHPRLSVFSSGSYERNRFAGFTRRTDEAVGLSWKALLLPWDTLAVDGGAVFTQQTNVDATTKNFLAARLAGALKHAFSKSSYFQQLAEYIPDLQSTGEYRFNSESSVIAPLSSHAGIKIGYVVRYNSAPPTRFGPTDRVLTSGIQVSF